MTTTMQSDFDLEGAFVLRDGKRIAKRFARLHQINDAMELDNERPVGSRKVSVKERSSVILLYPWLELGMTMEVAVAAYHRRVALAVDAARYPDWDEPEESALLERTAAYQSGFGWATSGADLSQLRRLRRTIVRWLDGSAERMLLVFSGLFSCGIGHHLHRALVGPEAELSDPGSVEAFWNEAVGGGEGWLIDDLDFADGFLQGAFDAMAERAG